MECRCMEQCGPRGTMSYLEEGEARRPAALSTSMHDCSHPGVMEEGTENCETNRSVVVNQGLEIESSI